MSDTQLFIVGCIGFAAMVWATTVKRRQWSFRLCSLGRIIGLAMTARVAE